MKSEQFPKKHFENDDYSRFSGPDYLDRISLSHAVGEFQLPLGHEREDPLIYEDACEVLLNDHHVDSNAIDIEVKNGIITLTGHVESREMKKNAEACIEDIRGVVDVFNLLNIYEFKEMGPQGIVKSQARI